jgi:hypothetical protein
MIGLIIMMMRTIAQGSTREYGVNLYKSALLLFADILSIPCPLIEKKEP